MPTPTRDALLRSVEDFAATLDRLEASKVVVAKPVLLSRLDELSTSAETIGDPIILAMIEKLRRRLTTGSDLDG
jgi:hypothetical protein